MGSCPDTDIDPFLLPQGSVILYRLRRISCFSGGTERGLVITDKELIGGCGYSELIASDAGGGIIRILQSLRGIRSILLRHNQNPSIAPGAYMMTDSSCRMSAV